MPSERSGELGAQKNTRYGSKGELETDVAAEKVIEQQKQQRPAQRGKLVPLPVKEGPDVQQQNHYRRPHHRGVHPAVR